jgi:hypothetical protein
MTSPSLVARLPRGESVALALEEARRLVAALWDISTTRGAVVTIGKIEHRLSDEAADPVVDVSELEAAAIRAALDADDELTPGLAKLRDAARG